MLCLGCKDFMFEIMSLNC